MRKVMTIGSLCSAAWMAAFPAVAGRFNWNSSVNGSFTDPAKWDAGAVPGAGSDVYFGAGGSYTVQITSDTQVGYLRCMGNSVTLDLNGHTLEVNKSSSTGDMGLEVTPNDTDYTHYLQIQNGTVVSTNKTQLGLHADGWHYHGTLLLDNAHLSVGTAYFPIQGFNSCLRLSNGSTLDSQNLRIEYDGTNSLEVFSGSSLRLTDWTCGYLAEKDRICVSNAAALLQGTSDFGDQGKDNLFQILEGGAVTNNGYFHLGQSGTSNTLQIVGGSMVSAKLYMGEGGGSANKLSIIGTNSALTMTDDFFLGSGATGTGSLPNELEVRDGGTMNLNQGGALYVGANGSSGMLGVVSNAAIHSRWLVVVGKDGNACNNVLRMEKGSLFDCIRPNVGWYTDFVIGRGDSADGNRFVVAGGTFIGNTPVSIGGHQENSAVYTASNNVFEVCNGGQAFLTNTQFSINNFGTGNRCEVHGTNSVVRFCADTDVLIGANAISQEGVLRIYDGGRVVLDNALILCGRVGASNRVEVLAGGRLETTSPNRPGDNHALWLGRFSGSEGNGLVVSNGTVAFAPCNIAVGFDAGTSCWINVRGTSSKISVGYLYLYNGARLRYDLEAGGLDGVPITVANEISISGGEPTLEVDATAWKPSQQASLTLLSSSDTEYDHMVIDTLIKNARLTPANMGYVLSRKGGNLVLTKKQLGTVIMLKN